MESSSGASVSDVIITENENGDDDVIVIDDDMSSAVKSSLASSTSSPVKMNKMCHLSSAVSLLPLRFNQSLQGATTSSQVSWQPRRQVIQDKSSTIATKIQSPVLLATQLLKTPVQGVQVIQGAHLVQNPVSLLQNKECHLLPTSLCSTVIQTGSLMTSSVPASVNVESTSSAATSKYSKSIVLVLPSTLKCSDSSHPVQLKSQNFKVQSLFKTSSTSQTQDAGHKANNVNKIYLIQKGKNISQLQKMELSQTGTALSSLALRKDKVTKLTSGKQSQSVSNSLKNTASHSASGIQSHFVSNSLKNTASHSASGIQSQFVSNSLKNTASHSASGKQSQFVSNSLKNTASHSASGIQSQFVSNSLKNTASHSASGEQSQLALNALINIANKISNPSVNNSSAGPKLQLVTVNKDGPVSFIDDTKQNAFQQMCMLPKKVTHTVSHCDNHLIESSSCPFSATPPQPAQQGITNLLKNNRIKRSYPWENIPLQGDKTPLLGQKCNTEKPTSSILLQKLSSSSVNSVSAEKITQAISSLTQCLLNSDKRITSNSNRDFLLKIDDQHVLVKIPQDFPLNQSQATISTSLLPAAKPATMQPKPTTEVNSALRSYLMKQQSSVQTFHPQNTVNTIAKEKGLKIADKQTIQMKDPVVRVKRSEKVQPEIINENVYFTTVRTGNGPIAVRVIQPNFEDDLNLNNQVQFSSVCGTKKINVDVNDISTIENCNENVSAKTQIGRLSNIFPSVEQLDDNQARIQKSAKLEKIVENILRSHKTNENTVHMELFRNEDTSTVFHSSCHKVINEKSAPLEYSLSDCQDSHDMADSDCDLNIKIASVFSLNPEASISEECKNDKNVNVDTEQKSKETSDQIVNVDDTEQKSEETCNQIVNVNDAEQKSEETSNQIVNVDTDNFTLDYQNSEERSDQSEDVDIENISYNYQDYSTWSKCVTPCYVVLERINRSSPAVTDWTQSHCSEYCRKRTLDYLCHYKLINCELVQDHILSDGECQEDLGKDQTHTCKDKTLIHGAGSNLECLLSQTKIDNTDTGKSYVDVPGEIQNSAVKIINICMNSEYMNSSTNKISIDSESSNQIADHSELLNPSINVIFTDSVSSNHMADLKSNTQQVNSCQKADLKSNTQQVNNCQKADIKSNTQQVNSNQKAADIKSNTQQVNSCQKADIKSNLVNSCQKTDIKSNLVNSCQKADIKSNLVNSCQKADIKSNLVNICQKTDIKSNNHQEKTLMFDSHCLNSKNENNLDTSLQNLGAVNYKSTLQVANVKVLSKPAIERSTVVKIPSCYSMVTNPSIQSCTSLLKPKNTYETTDGIFCPDKSFSNKNVEAKEFHELLTELKSQVERKRQDMKKFHESRIKIKNVVLNNKRKIEQNKKKEVNEKAMSQKFAVSPMVVLPGKILEREKLVNPVVLPSADKTKAKNLRPLASKAQIVLSGQSLQSSTLTVVSSQIPVEKIKEAMSSLTKYLLATGTKVTSDNNKYFLLKIDDKHVLVKIPQDFPLNQNLTFDTSTKLIPIQPKPAASSLSYGLQSQLMKKPSCVKTIIPQSQRSATLMARINRNRPNDQTYAEQTHPTIVQNSTLTLDSLHNPQLPVKIDLAHLPLTSSLLPQRRKMNAKLSDEDKRVKRARLEAKYPLPPKVIIKSEPDDQNVNRIVDNWPVASELLTTSSPSASNEVEMSGELHTSITVCELNRHCAVNQLNTYVDEQLTVTDDEPPTLLSVTASAQDDPGLLDNDSEAETPPLLQPMLPCLVSKITAGDQSHLAEALDDTSLSGVLSQTSLLSCDSGYVTDNSQSTLRQRPAYKNSKIERLKELLKKKEQEIEAIRKNKR